ncbi:hypothetical protein [Methylotuvimicrobium sp.]
MDYTYGADDRGVEMIFNLAQRLGVFFQASIDLWIQEVIAA